MPCTNLYILPFTWLFPAVTSRFCIYPGDIYTLSLCMLKIPDNLIAGRRKGSLVIFCVSKLKHNILYMDFYLSLFALLRSELSQLTPKCWSNKKDSMENKLPFVSSGNYLIVPSHWIQCPPWLTKPWLYFVSNIKEKVCYFISIEICFTWLKST